MAKKRGKKKPKKTNPTKRPRRRNTARKSPGAPRRKRRNGPNEKGPTMVGVVGGAVAGFVLGGLTDYALAGYSMTATPTARAVIETIGGVAQVGVGYAVGGKVGGVLMGSGGAFIGIGGANGARALSVAIQGAKTADKPQTADKTLQPNADGGGMSAIVPAVGQSRGAPAQLSQARRTNMGAVVLNKGGLSALVMKR